MKSRVPIINDKLLTQSQITLYIVHNDLKVLCRQGAFTIIPYFKIKISIIIVDHPIVLLSIQV